MNKIYFSEDFVAYMEIVLEKKKYDKFFVLTDSRVASIYRLMLEQFLKKFCPIFIVIPEGEKNKTIASVEYIWKELENHEATRHSCLINFGGGMITDIGGFAASTFKRGIDFVNVPTTMLAIVDASVGGKTGFNFNNLKNEIGLFAEPEAVVIHTAFLRSISQEDFMSGYAEMLKHALLDCDEQWADILNFDTENHETKYYGDLLRKNVAFKERVVKEDPHEGNLRKILNLGHTFGHAFEMLSQDGKRKQLTHGYAVAFGLVCELYLSCIKLSFPTEKMRQTVRYIREHYGTFSFTCNDYDALYDMMKRDKKNCDGKINFTLLKDIGKPEINCQATKEEVFEAFDFLREGM